MGSGINRPYPHMLTIISWRLIGQIPLQHQVPIDPADGNNLSVSLYQQAGNDLAAHQSAAVGKRGVQIAVGIEPRQSARNRCAVAISNSSHHDLSVRLESDRLRLAFEVAAETEGRGTKGRILDPCFAETRYLGFRVYVAVADTYFPSHNKVAIRLKKDRAAATRPRLGSRYQRPRRHHGLQHSRGAELH